MKTEELEKAFGSKKENWTEHQRRVVMQIEYLEKALKDAQWKLNEFRIAASEDWLSERRRSESTC